MVDGGRLGGAGGGVKRWSDWCFLHLRVLTVDHLNSKFQGRGEGEEEVISLPRLKIPQKIGR